MRLIQLQHPRHGRRVAMVEGDTLRLFDTFKSVYAMAAAAIDSDVTLADLVPNNLGKESLPYDEIYEGQSEWKLLPPFDHPDEPAFCFITGTGLSHKKSADNRQAMHVANVGDDSVSDSMKMYLMGMEGGRPAPGVVGVQPEWFYKCNGTRLQAHNEPLEMPPFAMDGGEEAEPVGAYLVGPNGMPWRVGFAVGNEFSDHVLEQQNYLYLSSSKLRACSLGPELVVGEPFDDIVGEVRVERDGNVIWRTDVATGEANMCHSVQNLEHHHFKYPEHRRPGDVHLHFFGADAFSYGDKLKLQDGDVMVIHYPKLGRPLRNPMKVEPGPQPFVPVNVL
ncbi:AraD1 family protein [Phycisphaerales bacterium AB-hyl4]|uniref:AraD1 family protein n=1 Tax=Natronomicrosphaera hydrolytica TaxID=3242702 RepID=A0ABV4U2Y6_9BACT